MGALSSSSLSIWLPQDDLMLKQAIEGGASLESLAKGAKRFSRKFTIKEFQKRWYALLYDPVISAEASIHMFQLERSSSTTKSKSKKEVKCMLRKRKADSVHKCYYSKKKRLGNDPIDLMDMNFLNGIENCGNREIPSSKSCLIADEVTNVFCDSNIVATRTPTVCENADYGSNACSPSFGYSAKPEMLNWSVREDFNESALADALGMTYQPMGTELCDSSVVANGNLNSLSDLINQITCDNTQGSAADHEEYFKMLKISLLNCSTKELLSVDELLLIDELLSADDNRFSMNMKNSNSLLLNFPVQNDMSTVGVTETRVSVDDQIQISSREHGGETGARVCREYGNGVICCVLNTEDTEIPNNDDVFLPYRIPSMATSFIGDTDADMYRNFNEPSNAGPLSDEPSILNHEFHDSLIPNHGQASVYQYCEVLFRDSDLSDEEEISSDSDGVLPHCSDVEAMILDLDLIPDEEDSYISERLAKYQSEGAKRTIMRLEQGVDSCMKRTMSAQRAYAVLYGLHSTYFIKKTEVLIGRGTDDVKVDIDLGKEGWTNSISRRQAMIKMDINGTFHLKNYGKNSIFVNGKEIARGQKVALLSGSLLEVRRISFIFEINRAYVKRHLDN